MARELWADLKAERPVRGLAIELSVRPEWRIGAVESPELSGVRRVDESGILIVLDELASPTEIRATVRR